MKKYMLYFSLMTGIAAFAAVPTDVYLLIGQSNMAGFLGKEGWLPNYLMESCQIT